MLNWLQSSCEFNGAILFRGTLAPAATAFMSLTEKGFRLRHLPGAAQRWAMELQHPRLGTAILSCDGTTLPVKMLARWCPTLTPREGEEVSQAGHHLAIKVSHAKTQVLRDRKHALRLTREIMGNDALGVIDLTAQHIWSPRALDDELLHDADLDISQIYGVHWVRESSATEDSDANDEEAGGGWLHTHGLGEIGFFDFDILYPSAEVIRTPDILRCIGFAIVEGRLSRSTARMRLSNNGGVVGCVETSVFDRETSNEWVRLRGGNDEFHTGNRVILCDPRSRLPLWWRRKIRPSRFLQTVGDRDLFYRLHDRIDNADE